MAYGVVHVFSEPASPLVGIQGTGEGAVQQGVFIQEVLHGETNR